ncbi:radical SAM protein [Planctomycetaceae bacterium SCGC AG-212-F19]|nr:radical SAM protein [Planctomycetaceae bacterium SCGC AG-212-F19]
MHLSILYRGPLSSCNYGCAYCPFAKHAENAAELAADRRALERFVDWVGERQSDQIGILFTPWGEALIRRWYQDALIRLTHIPHVVKAAIQTNLSCRLDWLARCNRDKLALWTTFHPTEVSRAAFLTRCRQVDALDVRYSVGVVGLKEHESEIAALRRELPAHVYLWINAYKREPDYYAEEDIRRLEVIDRLFRVNTVHHPSEGRDCRAGHTVISVAGDGTIHRCHFIRETIGNIYEPGFERALVERRCTNATCGCHIGYVHMKELNLYEVFGPGVLERIPRTFATIRAN